MRQITIADIRVRLKGLQNSTESNKNRLFIESAQSIINSNRVSDIKRFIESCAISNNQLPFFVYCELFDSICKNGTIGDICNIGNYIAENVIPKSRDSKSTNSLLKRRLTVLQHKLQSPVNKSLENITINSVSINTAPSNPAPTTEDEAKDNAVSEAYNIMLDKSIIMIHCDRVIENYNRVSKRFNLDKLFIENTRSNDTADVTINLCEMIDTYNMPTAIKFNTVIETAWYGFESNNVAYSKSDILESAVDYFLFKHDGLNSCKEILEATLFFDKNEDMKNIDIFTEEEPEASVSIDEAIINSYSLKTIQPVQESTDFNEIFNKFKKEELSKTDKPQDKFKSLLDKLYRKDVNSIVNETPDLLKWVRRFFILGACAVPHIGPILAGITFIADKFISIYKDREELPKMIKCFNNEIKVCKAKEKELEDKDEKEKMEKYIKSLETAKNKINSYYMDLLTEEEQEKMYDNMYSEYDSSDDILDDDWDDIFGEGTIIASLTESISNFIDFSNTNLINESSMYRLIPNISENDISTLAKIVSKHPDIFYKESVIEGIQDTISALRTGKINSESALAKSVKISSFTNALSILEKNDSEPISIDIYNLVEVANEFEAISEAYTAIAIIIDTYNNQNSILEASFTNTLKVASMKLRNSLTKMSDKERSISRNLDIGMNNFKKSIERALTNDNRESIIKGSVLPSFSKIVKMCIINAGLIALGQPAIAIIGTLGYFAINNKFKAKERQMVIDEIEIELEMCEKYIDIAERKNDMKALRQLLTTKKELERQRQRIKYKMRVDFGQKYYDSKAPTE